MNHLQFYLRLCNDADTHPDERPSSAGLVIRKAVCPTCKGRGVTVHGWGGPNGPHASFTPDEWNALHRDDRDAYAAGEYDAPCPECGGANVVDDVDRDESDATALAELDAYVREWAESDSIQAQEIARGA